MIGQAKDIIMEHYHVTPDTTFAVLARVYPTTNLKLGDVAAELCRTGNPPQASHAPQSVASLARRHGHTAA